MSADTTVSTAADRSRISARHRPASRRARGLTVLAAAATGLIGWAVAVPLAGVDLAVRLGPAGSARHIGPADVAVACLLAGLAGWSLLAILERFTQRARVVWTGIALVALAVSLTGPLAGLTTAVTVALLCLHLLVAAVLITGLRRRWSPRP